LQARWAEGEHIPVECYLLRHPELSADADAVLELVLLEVALREESGQRPSLAELTRRFPHLAELLRRQLTLHGLFRQPTAAAEDSRLSQVEFGVAEYVLLQEIGRGGMGTVYVARHRGDNQRVALKMLPGTVAPESHERERFATEAEALGRLQHPHIVHVYEVGLHHSQPFIAFELVEGGTLADRLRQGLPTAQASVALVATLAWAVDAVHQHGIVHRDLKPANILLLPATETELGVPKIADFGLAKLLDNSTQLTRSGDVLGTPAYLAPEQVSGNKEIGPAADVYGLGAILYEMLTGRPPFRGASAAETLWQVANVDPLPPSHVQPGVPRELQTISLKCLEKSPRRRYLTAAALARDLERWLRGEPIQARPLGLLGHLARHARRRPLAATLLMVLLVALVLGFLGVTWSWRTESALRQKAEKSLYRSRMAEAALRWQSNDVAGAREQLESCLPHDGTPDHRGWEWHYLRRLCNTEETALPHRYWVQELAVSPDGRELAVATGDPSVDYPQDDSDRPGELVTWDLAANPSSPRGSEPAERWRRGPSEVRVVTYSPDGRWLAWGTTFTVHLFDRAAGEVRHSWRQPGIVFSLCFCGDSKQLACASSIDPVKCDARVYDVASGTMLRQRVDAGEAWWRQRLCYSPDGLWLACQRSRGGFFLWDPLNNTEKLWGPNADAAQLDWRLSGLSFLAGGRQLVSAGAEGVNLWDMASGRQVSHLSGHSGVVSALAVAPDGRTLATAGADQTIRLWDGSTRQEKQVLRGHTWTVRGLAFTPDTRKLFSGGQDRMVKRWDVTRPQRGLLLTFADRINSITFTANGGIRAVRIGGSVRSWTMEGTATDNPRLDMTDDRSYLHSFAEFLPRGEAIVSVSRDDARVLKIWSAEDGRERIALRGHTLPIHTVAVDAYGRFIASAAWDPEQPARGSEIKVWNIAIGQPCSEFTAANVLAVSLALSPDGRRLAVGEQVAGSPARRSDTAVSVSLWQIGDGSCQAERREHRGAVTSVAFSPDGRLLASTGFTDGQVCLMDASDLRVLHRTPGPQSPTCLCFDPSGWRLAAIGFQGIVHLLDAEDGQEVLRLPGLVGNRDDDPISDARVRFSADGRWLLSTNWDNTLNVWDGRPFAGTLP
jgi:WD40 repeat protein/serine/threonine protein kinase